MTSVLVKTQNVHNENDRYHTDIGKNNVNSIDSNNDDIHANNNE